MSAAVVDRALAAAAEHDYSGPETRALVRMAMDADHDTGENCVTGLARVHEAAGYMRTVRKDFDALEALGYRDEDQGGEG